MYRTGVPNVRSADRGGLEGTLRYKKVQLLLYDQKVLLVSKKVLLVAMKVLL